MGHLTYHTLLSSNAFWAGTVAGFLATMFVLAVSLLVLNWFDRKHGFYPPAPVAENRSSGSGNSRPQWRREATPIPALPGREGGEL